MAQKQYTLADLAEITQSKLIGKPDYLIANVADLDSAQQQDVSFLSNSLYEKKLPITQAGAIFILPEIQRIEGKNYLVNQDPSRAFQTAVELFLQPDYSFTTNKGIHPSAIIHEKANLAADVNIGPYVIVEEGASIGPRSILGAGTFVGPYTVIGEDCKIYPNVTLRENIKIGNRVIIQSYSIIGSCGFGYVPDQQGRYHRLNQVGTVTIEDDVEVGPNCSIDRSRFKTTLIRRGTKIANSVVIAHNVEIGEDNIIIGQTGIAGSTKTKNHVIFAGQCGVAGHLTIAEGSIFAARSGISKSIHKPGKYGGSPVIPLAEHNRLSVHYRKLEEYATRIADLEAEIERLKSAK